MTASPRPTAPIADAPLVVLTTGVAPGALQLRHLMRAARGRRVWWVAYTRDLTDPFGWRLRESRELDPMTVSAVLVHEAPASDEDGAGSEADGVEDDGPDDTAEAADTPTSSTAIPPVVRAATVGSPGPAAAPPADAARTGISYMRAVAVTRAQSVARRGVKRVAKPAKKAVSVLPPTWQTKLQGVVLGHPVGRRGVPGQRLADALVVGPLLGRAPELLIALDRASAAAGWYLAQQVPQVTVLNGVDPAVRYLDYATDSGRDAPRVASPGGDLHWRHVVGDGDEHDVLAALPPLDEARVRVLVADSGAAGGSIASSAARTAARAGFDVVVLDVGSSETDDAATADGSGPAVGTSTEGFLVLSASTVTVRPPAGPAQASTCAAVVDELAPDLVVTDAAAAPELAGTRRHTNAAPELLGAALSALGTPRPHDRTHLLVAPANYAGQSAAWSRAVREHAGINARNLAVAKPDAPFAFPADFPLTSPEWRRPEVRARVAVEAVLPATHVLLEAMRPVLGASRGTEDVDGWDFGLGRADVDTLLASGRRVALLFHGSELRRPERHRAEYAHSPFALPEYAEATRRMVAATERVHGLVRDLGGPVFVSTLDLLDDLPSATWLPVVVGADSFRPAPPVLRRRRPVVVHVPSNPFLKGTSVIEPVLRRMHSQGVVEYRRLDNMPSAFVGDFIREADVVVDQIVLGNPGVLAAEAMASGRLVLAHIAPHVRARFPVAPPVVEATPDTFESVLRAVARDPQAYRETAELGPLFAERLHSGALSAQVLADFLDS